MSQTASLILRSLLAKGYFPKELPPVFTTVDFGNHAAEILDDWERGGVYKNKSSKEFQKIDGCRFRGKKGYKRLPAADPEIISKPKKLFERRNIHITHPVPQALLAREIAENWRTIQKWLSRQTFSEDEIVVADYYDRAVKGINFQLHRAKTDFIEATSDWLVKTDITRFYPSIYTHSIPWSAYGKGRVKSALKAYEGSLADRLDILVRACNRNQTVGIPIGPETSRILAEVISSRIDVDFISHFDEMTHASGIVDLRTVDRLQDDWTVGTSSLERAENILSAITKCYREYGLEINGAKTTVTHLMKSGEMSWKSEISAFLSHRQDLMQGSRLKEFLALCLRLQLQMPSDPVLNYALAIIEGYRFRREDLELVETFLLKAAAVAPVSLDRICRIVLNINHKTGGLSKSRLMKRFIELAEKHIENGSLYEVIWLLYTVRGLRQAFFSKKIIEASENIQSSSLRLILLELDSMGLCIKSLPKHEWEREISKERSLSDWTWLYGYEAIRKGWLSDPANVLNSPFFKPMNDRNVVFYDPKRNVPRSEKVRRAAARVREADRLQVERFITLLRGLDQAVISDPEY